MTTVYDFNPCNLPQQALAAIGLAITSFAQTEQFIQEAIAGCLGVDVEYGKAVTVHMAMPLRLSVLRSSAEIRIDDLDVLDELDRHIVLIEDCIGRRNSLAHRQWCRDQSNQALFTVRENSRMRVELDLLPMTVEKIKADAAFIYQTGIDFFEFMVANGLLPTIPSVVRPRDHKSQAARKKRRNSQ